MTRMGMVCVLVADPGGHEAMTDGSTSGVQVSMQQFQYLSLFAALRYGSLTIRLKGGDNHGP